MVKNAEETARDSALINAAMAAVAATRNSGSFISRELVDRMADEERFVQSSSEESSPCEATRIPYSVTLASTVDERRLASQKGVKPGNYASAELARRMQLEADLASSQPTTGEVAASASSSPNIDELVGATFFDRKTFAALQVEVKAAVEQAGQELPAPVNSCGGTLGGPSLQTQPDTGNPFYITMGAVLNESVSQEALEKLLGPEFSKARLYWRRPFMLAVERLVHAPSKLDATLRVAEDIQAAFPDAEMVDVSGLPRNLIDALDEMAYDGALTEQELEDALGPFARSPGFGIARGTSVCWVEAEVFEVFDTPELIHLRSEDNRIYAFNRGTSVWNAFEKVDVGQRFRCLIASRFGVVLRALRITGGVDVRSDSRRGDA